MNLKFLRKQSFNLCAIFCAISRQQYLVFYQDSVYMYMKYLPCLRIMESQWNFWPAAFDNWRISYQNCFLSKLIKKIQRPITRTYKYTYLFSRVFYIQWIWLYLLGIHSLFLYFKGYCCWQNTTICHNSFV